MRTPLFLFPHPGFGNQRHYLVVAAAAAGGAVGYFLDGFKCRQNIVEIFVLVKDIQNIEIADLLAVADHIIFNHGNFGRN